ncbi:MAG: ribonuclease P protein component [Lachnospiraceae bacterium]|nr:ribonuclease P protein component [Lachnospiraceae bacterium]
MRNVNSLKNSRQFAAVYQNGKSKANKYLVMYVLPNDHNEIRIGISVSKKVGNSIVRHRLTRLIRETYRLHREELADGYDIVVIARNSAKDKSYQQIESAFMHLVSLHHLNIC